MNLLIALLLTPCSADQLLEAGQRVRGSDPVNQALILAEVGCVDLADQQIDAVLVEATGQYRLHALYARGQVALRRCRSWCSEAQAAHGRAALEAVYRSASAQSQAAVAQETLKQLDAVLAQIAARRAAQRALPGPAEPKPIKPAPTRLATVVPPPPEPSNARLYLWIGSAAAGVAGTTFGILGWQAYDEANDLGGSRTFHQCGGRTEAECRRAYDDAVDRRRLYTGFAAGLGATAVGLALTAALWGDDPEISLGAGPGWAGLAGRW